jgi:hypothetical protein
MEMNGPLHTPARIPILTEQETSHGQDGLVQEKKKKKKKRFFSSKNVTDRLWGPPTILLNTIPMMFPEGKAVRSDVDRSIPADVKEWSYTSTPLIRPHGMDNFTQKAYNKIISTTSTIHIIMDVHRFHLKH